jgi:hypothetical protein
LIFVPDTLCFFFFFFETKILCASGSCLFIFDLILFRYDDEVCFI